MKKAPEIKIETDLILKDFDKNDIKNSMILSSEISHVMSDTPIFSVDSEKRELCIFLINAANNWRLG